jgi:polyisoprenoid-binding protein YceI
MSTANGTAPVALLPPGSWELDSEGSTVGFEVRHLKLLRLRGRFGAVDADVSSDELGVSSIIATVAVASIYTGDPRRDQRLLGADFLDVVRHPVIFFSGVCAPVAEEAPLRVLGTITVCGFTAPLELQAMRVQSGDDDGHELRKVRVRADGALSRRELGLERDPRFAVGGVVVDDRVAIRLDMALARCDPY